MPTLWLKFSEETSLPLPLSTDEKKKLEALFDVRDANSMWNRALRALGLRHRGDSAPLIRWHGETPYIRWDAVVGAVSCGWLKTAPNVSGGYSYATSFNLFALPRLLASQWKIEGYLRAGSVLDPLCESTALGLALLALMLRLPQHLPDELAIWLAHPEEAPSAVRKTVENIQAVQVRRTGLSAAWNAFFANRPRGDFHEEAPEYFWDEPQASTVAPETPRQNSSFQSVWKGQPVCPGRVSGVALFVDSKATPADFREIHESRIFVFARARPETTEFFQHAQGIVYAEGGVLSHACTVAREQAVVCATALGRDFLKELKARLATGSPIRITIDGGTGTVEFETE